MSDIPSAGSGRFGASALSRTIAAITPMFQPSRPARRSTRDRNKITLEKHIKPHPIGVMKLQLVKPVHVQQWIDRLAAKMDPSTVRTLYSTLRAAFARADALDVVDRTPCRGIKLPTMTNSDRSVLSENDVRRLIEETTGDTFHAVWVLVSVLGRRIGEVIGLRWSHADFDRRTLRAERTIDTAGQEPMDDRRVTDDRVVPTRHHAAGNLHLSTSHAATNPTRAAIEAGRGVDR